MIGIYEKCKSQAESLAQIESDWTFRKGVSFLKSNISCTKQSNLLLHFLRTENCLSRSFGTVEYSSLCCLLMEEDTFSTCSVGLNSSKTFCVTFAYFINTNHQPEKLFWQFTSKHFKLENGVKMTPKRRFFLPALFFTCFCITKPLLIKTKLGTVTSQ